MAGPRKTEQQWREILERQRSSRLSIKQFCANAGVSQASFYKWRKKLGGQSASKPRARSHRPVDNESGFVALKLLESSDSLELVHPHGCIIRITGDVNSVTLQQVLSVLDGGGAA